MLFLGDLVILKISSYLPFQSEFYFNGHNYFKQVLDQKNINYRVKENAVVEIENPEIINEINKELNGRLVKERIDYWMRIGLQVYAQKKYHKIQIVINNYYDLLVIYI